MKVECGKMSDLGYGVEVERLVQLPINVFDHGLRIPNGYLARSWPDVRARRGCAASCSRLDYWRRVSRPAVRTRPPRHPPSNPWSLTRGRPHP
jgi:hypothetical protein